MKYQQIKMATNLEWDKPAKKRYSKQTNFLISISFTRNMMLVIHDVCCHDIKATLSGKWLVELCAQKTRSSNGKENERRMRWRKLKRKPHQHQATDARIECMFFSLYIKTTTTAEAATALLLLLLFYVLLLLANQRIKWKNRWLFLMLLFYGYDAKWMYLCVRLYFVCTVVYCIRYLRAVRCRKWPWRFTTFAGRFSNWKTNE